MRHLFFGALECPIMMLVNLSKHSLTTPRARAVSALTRLDIYAA
jgi:hypothetical protein